ncbi:MAG: hypothetical protein GF403_03440 [Candidatus Coatesbacteria bacterium]|nr:hypothetical protein [Candidatus Coatesbacteria bacterium]
MPILITMTKAAYRILGIPAELFISAVGVLLTVATIVIIYVNAKKTRLENKLYFEKTAERDRLYRTRETLAEFYKLIKGDLLDILENLEEPLVLDYEKWRYNYNTLELEDEIVRSAEAFSSFMGIKVRPLFRAQLDIIYGLSNILPETKGRFINEIRSIAPTQEKLTAYVSDKANIERAAANLERYRSLVKPLEEHAEPRERKLGVVLVVMYIDEYEQSIQSFVNALVSELAAILSLPAEKLKERMERERRGLE